MFALIVPLLKRFWPYILIVTLVLGIWGTFEYQQHKISKQSLLISQFQDAQKTNLETIGLLKDYQAQQTALYAARAKVQSKTATRVRNIDNLRKDVKNETHYGVADDNSILNYLDRMWGTDGNKDTGDKTGMSGTTGKTTVLPCDLDKSYAPATGESKVVYCLDEDNFINALKNNELMYGYFEEDDLVHGKEKP